ncbi:MAG: hypothetical protein FWD28_03660 [Treponema sp.]|nr:hypothetical protein [Treponema sp.]
MTISQTIDIPADRRITLEVPREIPTGTTARYELVWFPVTKTANNLNTTLEKIQELCKNSSITVDSFKEMRRKDKELEENQYRRLFSGDIN